jgi:hypothetical protein
MLRVAQGQHPGKDTMQLDPRSEKDVSAGTLAASYALP